jgi:hypothetical protein
MGNNIFGFNSDNNIPIDESRCDECIPFRIVSDGTVFRKISTRMPNGPDAYTVDQMQNDILGVSPWTTKTTTVNGTTTKHPVYRYDFAEKSRLYVVTNGENKKMDIFVHEHPSAQYSLSESVPHDFVKLILSVLMLTQPVIFRPPQQPQLKRRNAFSNKYSFTRTNNNKTKHRRLDIQSTSPICSEHSDSDTDTDTETETETNTTPYQP